jgi:HPt (histidine-containing phosphotransfer) domain-containing protein
MLAEDDRASQLVMTLLLNRLGQEPEQVTDRQGLLRAIGSRSYDLIFLDLILLNSQGIAIAQIVRMAAATGTRPLLIGIGASCDEATRASYLTAGLYAFLEKPVTLPALERLMRVVQQSYLAEVGSPPARPLRSVTPDPDVELTEREEDRSLRDIRARILRYVGDDRSATVKEAITIFLASTDALLQRLHTATECKDTELFRRSVHSLKGSSHLMGAFRLAALCAKIEIVPIADLTDGFISDTVQEIEAQLARVRSLLLTLKAQ